MISTGGRETHTGFKGLQNSGIYRRVDDTTDRREWSTKPVAMASTPRSTTMDGSRCLQYLHPWNASHVCFFYLTGTFSISYFSNFLECICVIHLPSLHSISANSHHCPFRYFSHILSSQSLGGLHSLEAGQPCLSQWLPQQLASTSNHNKYYRFWSCSRHPQKTAQKP